MLIQLTSQKAPRRLHHLGELQPIRILPTQQVMAPPKKLSNKYKGILSKQAGRELNEHIQQMRSAWHTI